MQSAAPTKEQHNSTFVLENGTTWPFTLAARLSRVERKLDVVLDEVTMCNAGLTEVLAILRGAR